MKLLVEKYPGITLDNDAFRNFLKPEDNEELLSVAEKDTDHVYGELSVDEIDESTILPFDLNEILNGIPSINNIKIYDESDIKEEDEVLYRVLYKNGKFIPAPRFFGDFEPSLSLLKMLSKKYTGLSTLSIAVSISNYQFKSNDITPKFASAVDSALEHLTGNESIVNYIWIDKNRNVSAVFRGYANDINGVPLNFEFRVNTKEELEKLYRYAKIMNEINRLTPGRARVIASRDNTIKWVLDGKIIDDNDFDELARKNRDTLIGRYDDAKNKFSTSYYEYYKVSSRYWSIVDEILGYIDFLKDYNSKSVIKRALERHNEALVNSPLPTSGSSIFYGDFESLKSKILFSREKINFIDPDISFDDIDDVLAKIKDIEFTRAYIDNLNYAVKKKNIELEKVLSTLKAMVARLNQRKLMDILKDRGQVDIPNVDFDIEISPIKERSEVSTVDHETELLDELQVLQSVLLSDDEKLALMVYKALFYYPINRILSAKRNGNCTLEFIESVIQEAYADYKKRLESPIMRSDIVQTKYRIDNLLNRNRTLSYDEFKSFVIGSTPLVESALKKITIDEDIVVYRAVHSKEPSQLGDHFLSTSLDSSQALSFLSSAERDNNYTPILYKITIPAGSPLILFSTELFSGIVDHEDPCRDMQREVLIDAANFDFEIGKTTALKNLRSSMGNIDEAFLVEVKSVPIKKIDKEGVLTDSPHLKKP